MVCLTLDGADLGMAFAQILMRGVAHVDPEDVGASFEQPLDHFWPRRSGA
jgi:hypothetical protein